MQNCGAESVSDETLEVEGATVKFILFYVIRRGDEYGNNHLTETTVIPMQVLVNRPQLKSMSFTKSAESVGLDLEEENTYP